MSTPEHESMDRNEPYVDVHGDSFNETDLKRWADEAEAYFPNSPLVSETPSWIPAKRIDP